MIIGIDLGTTNSAVAYIDESNIPQIIPNRDGNRITPSVILFEGKIPVVGEFAKSESIAAPQDTIQFVKRQMGEGGIIFVSDDGSEFTAEELSAIILKKLKKDAEDFLGKEVDEAVITVPAYFDDAQRKATQDAGKIAGLKVLKVINEPTAAALAYGVSKNKKNQKVLVYDLGGGTFDVTLMELNNNLINILATDGHKNLGGVDFDNLIMEYVANEFKKAHRRDIYEDDTALQELRLKSEECKKKLSTREKSIISISAFGKSFKIELNRDKFDDLIMPFINDTIHTMEGVLKHAKLTWKDIDKILLVGGSTRVKAIADKIESVSGIKVSRDINPDEAVAIGAAIQGALISKTPVKDKITFIRDVNSHSLGTIAFDSISNKLMNFVIIKKNTKLPCQCSQTFYTREENQEALLLDVTEGEGSNLESVRVLGQTKIKLPPRPKKSPITIVIYYDENSIVHVRAIDGVTNKDIGEINIERKANLSDKQVAEKKQKISYLAIG